MCMPAYGLSPRSIKQPCAPGVRLSRGERHERLTQDRSSAGAALPFKMPALEERCKRCALTKIMLVRAGEQLGVEGGARHPEGAVVHSHTPPCEGMTCRICLADTEETEAGACFELECGHVYHTRCIIDWFRRSSRGECPVCRSAPTVPQRPSDEEDGGSPSERSDDFVPQQRSPDEEDGGSPSESSDDLYPVLVLSEKEMHRVCAHVIYRNEAHRPQWESQVVSSYMAARRRLHTARRRETGSRSSDAQLQRRYIAASRKLLTYVSWRDSLPMLEVSG